MKLLACLLVSHFDFGFTVSIIGFGIVILALALLAFLFTKMPQIINLKFSFKKKSPENVEAAKKTAEPIEANVTAAISLAFHLYFNDLHDKESNVLTIKKVRKSYSPWSSKIYSVTQNWPK